MDSVDAAGTTLEVKVDYTLPGPASTYEGWEAPGTLNADGVSGTTTMLVSIGKTSTCPATFPQGTVISLSEDTTSASPHPQGYTWGSPTFRVGNQQTSTFTIADQTFALGTTCEVTEDADSAQVEGYTLTAPEPQTVTVAAPTEEEPAVTASFTNTYTRDTGSFSVVKAVEGDYSPTASDSVKISYTCDDVESTSGSLDVPMDGTAVTGPSLPTGTTCTLEEDADSAARDGYAVATVYSDTTVSVVKDSATSATVTNTYTRLTGGFAVSKTVDGDGASLAPAEFTFTYTCTDQVTGEAGEPVEVMVKAGETVEVSDVATGSCTVSEKDASVDGASLSTRLSVNGQAVDGGEATFEVTSGEDSAVAVSVTNTYAEEPPSPSPSPESLLTLEPSPSPEPSVSPSPGETSLPSLDPSTGTEPSPSGPESPQPAGSSTPTSSAVPQAQGHSLARTGASVVVPLPVALAAFVGGAVLLYRRRCS